MNQQINRLLVGVLCLGFLPACASVQEENWETLFAEAQRAYQQGLYGEAEELYLAALANSERFKEEDPRVSASLDHLAAFYRAQEKPEEAEPLYRRALEIREKLLGPEHLAVATSLQHLAWVCYERLNYAEAELLYRRALAIRENLLGPEHPVLSQNLADLGLLSWRQGKRGEVESLYRRALEINEKAFGPEDPSVSRQRKWDTLGPRVKRELEGLRG